MKRKKTKLVSLVLGIAFISALSVFLTQNADAGPPVVREKYLLDCGTWFGTKCENEGEGCSPKACKKDIQQ